MLFRYRQTSFKHTSTHTHKKKKKRKKEREYQHVAAFLSTTQLHHFCLSKMINTHTHHPTHKPNRKTKSHLVFFPNARTNKHKSKI